MEPAQTFLRKKCPGCGCWNRVKVLKHFVPQSSPEPKVRVVVPYYESLKVEKCRKCGAVLFEPGTLVRIVHKPRPRSDS